MDAQKRVNAAFLVASYVVSLPLHLHSEVVHKGLELDDMRRGGSGYSIVSTYRILERAVWKC